MTSSSSTPTSSWRRCSLTSNATKLLVALAFFAGALVLVLAFAEDEEPQRPPSMEDLAATLDGGPARDGTPGRDGTAGRDGASESCIDNEQNGRRVAICVSPTTVDVGEPVTVDAGDTDLGPQCGEPAIDFGDGSRSRALETEHQYRAPGSYVVSVVSAGCRTDARLRVSVRPAVP